MDLVVFENNKPYIIDEFREGRFDYIELASDVAETKFFQFLFDRGVVEELARHYPSPRRRHHVPLWMYVSSQLSLRLHGSHSFHSYPLIIRGGGLIDALGPEVARREVDPDTGDVVYLVYRIQRTQPRPAFDSVRSRLSPQAGQRDGSRKTGTMVQPPCGQALRRTGCLR